MLEPTMPPPIMMTSGDFKNRSLLNGDAGKRFHDSTRGPLSGATKLLGVGLAGERVQDALELRAARLLFEDAEWAQRPNGSGVAQQFVDEQLALGGLQF